MRPLTAKEKAACAGAFALCVTTTVSFEGIRLKPYYDSVHVQTVCAGETKVQMHVYTPAQCSEFLKTHMMQTYAPIVLSCVPKLNGYPLAAAMDFTYNTGHFCDTVMARQFVLGNMVAGCKAFPLYQFRNLRGITRRRLAETQLCLKGVK